MLRAGPFVDADLTSAASAAPTPGRASSTATPSCSRWAADERWPACAPSPTEPRTCSTRVGRRCLVHSDLNPKNLLVDPDTLAGHRAARLGVRPRRPPVHRPGQPAALRPGPGVRRGRAGGLVRAPRRTARRGLDAGPGRRPVGAGRPGRPRRGDNPVADRAARRCSARSPRRGDLHAVPGLPRVGRAGWSAPRRLARCARSLPASQTERTLARYRHRHVRRSARRPSGSETGLQACPHDSIHPRNPLPYDEQHLHSRRDTTRPRSPSTTSGPKRTSSPRSTRPSSTSTTATSSKAPSSRSTATRSCSTSATRPRASSPRASCRSSTTSTPTRSSPSATRSRPSSSRRRTRKAG